MHGRPQLRLWFGVLVLSLVVLWSLLATKPRGELPSGIVSAGGGTPTAAPRTPSAEAPSAKSKMKCADLFQLACLRRGVTVDPSGAVQPNVRGELEALRLYETIIHDNPEWTSEQVDEELVKKIYTERRRTIMLETFRWVAREMKRVIDHKPDNVLTRAVKKKLKQRIDTTYLELPPPASIYASEPDLFTKNEMYFESLENNRRVIRVGGAYLLTAKSWFNRVFTLSHELAHAIDPCELRADKIDPAAYRRLARCFYQQKIILKDPEQHRCGTKNQLGEAFADWMAAEITATAMEHYKERLKTHDDIVHSAINAVRDLCDQESWVAEGDTDLYPDPAVRIAKIFAHNPKIQKFLQCEVDTNEMPYCSF